MEPAAIPERARLWKRISRASASRPSARARVWRAISHLDRQASRSSVGRAAARRLRCLHRAACAFPAGTAYGPTAWERDGRSSRGRWEARDGACPLAHAAVPPAAPRGRASESLDLAGEPRPRRACCAADARAAVPPGSASCHDESSASTVAGPSRAKRAAPATPEHEPEDEDEDQEEEDEEGKEEEDEA